MEASMRRLNRALRHVIFAAGVLGGGFLIAGGSTPVTGQAPRAAATVFEGMRIIVGDGSPPVENAAAIVEGTRFVQVGRTGQLQVPAGAVRVDLRGKTVIPALIDTHTHLAGTRDALID